MDVPYTCHNCGTEQTAVNVTEEVPTPVGTHDFCKHCQARNFMDLPGRRKWLEDRDFEIRNTSHPRPFIEDVTSIDNLIMEYTLYYKGHYDLYRYQVGYYDMAVLFFQKLVNERGFTKDQKSFYKVTVSYKHVENNTHYHTNNEVVGHYGSMEAVEAGIAARMAWGGYHWLTRDHFTVEELT